MGVGVSVWRMRYSLGYGLWVVDWIVGCGLWVGLDWILLTHSPIVSLCRLYRLCMGHSVGGDIWGLDFCASVCDGPWAWAFM